MAAAAFKALEAAAWAAGTPEAAATAKTEVAAAAGTVMGWPDTVTVVVSETANARCAAL